MTQLETLKSLMIKGYISPTTVNAIRLTCVSGTDCYQCPHATACSSLNDFQPTTTDINTIYTTNPELLL